jgi:acetyl esterase
MPNEPERKQPMHAPVEVPTRGVGMPQRIRADEPDRDARAFLRCFNPFVRPVRHYSLRELRRRWHLLAVTLGEGKPVARVARVVIDGPAGPIELKIFHPEASGAAQPALLWCHGGGFLLGDTGSADAMCRSMARASGCVVVAPSYRLAPEHDLYAGREDVLAALQWIAQRGASIGVNPSRLAIGGDSAGGNIAAAVAQHCTQQGAPAVALQVLVYPATNLHSDYPSKAENARGYLLTAEVMDWMKARITGSTDLGDPWISPGRNAKLRGLPPALILTAGFDPVRDDGLDYAARLRAAGVPVELLHYTGQFHGFLNFDSVIRAGRDALQRIGGSLHRALRAGQPLDRTLEIADATPDTAVSVTEAVGELASVTLVLWESVGRWSATLLGLLSPAAIASSRLLLRPWLVVGVWTRRRIGERLDRLAVRQTHPARGV